MRTFRKPIACVAILTAVFAQAAFTLALQAEDEGSVLVLRPAQPATQTETSPPDEELPALPPPQERSAEQRQTRAVLRSGRPTDRPFMRPVAADGSVVEEGAQAGEPIPAPPEGEPVAPEGEQVVRSVDNIVYDTDRGARRMYASNDGVIETVMITENPADGCLYEIPVCLPACCVGEPTVESKRGLLGRGVVEYCWPCGFEVEVKFRIRGDVKVDYDA